MDNFINNKNIAFSLYGLFFLYQIFGVMIHKQYGFGFFYWPVQLYGMAIISFFILLTNIHNIFKISAKLLIFNLYFLSILSFQLLYLYSNSLDLFYLNDDEIIEIIIETVLWYFIALVMIFYYENILNFLNSKKLLIIYILIILIFIMYIIKLNLTFSSDISRAFWIGANFPSLSISKLSDSGYVKGFHLYFSPLFALFSIVYIFILQKEGKKRLSYFIFIISIYILFLASGRGSLLSFIFVTSIFLFNKKTLFYFILFCIFVFLIVSNSDFLNLLSEKNQRLYDILTLNFDDDKSSVGRLRQLEYNMNYIYDNWYTGGLRSYYAILGRGEYIHNVLGVLQEYGFVPFSILIFLFLHGLFLCLKIKKTDDYIVNISKSIFIYMLIESLLFKHISEIKILIPLIISYYYLIKTYKEKKNVI
jgi:hypothetical protein